MQKKNFADGEQRKKNSRCDNTPRKLAWCNWDRLLTKLSFSLTGWMHSVRSAFLHRCYQTRWEVQGWQSLFFFAIDNRWEQPVCMCFGRNGVNTYLSGLPWSTSKLHAWREKRKKTRKSVLRQTTCIFVLIEEAGNLKYTSDNLQ